MSELQHDSGMNLEVERPLLDGRLACVILSSLVFCWASHYMVNGDIWWHLRTGQLIPYDGVPDLDWYTFSSSDSKWIDLHWLFQLLVGWVYSAGDTEGLVLLKAVLSGITVLLLFLPFRSTIPSSLMILLGWPFVSLFASRLLVRPEMLSFLYLVLTLLVIHKSRQRIQWLYTLPAIQLLWVNSQGLFVLQYVVMMAFAIQVCWSHCICKNPIYDSNHWARHFLSAGILTGIATLLNPYGIEGALFPLELMEKMGGDHKTFYLEYAGEIRGLGDLFASNSIDRVLAIPAVLHLLFVCLLALGSLFLLGNQQSNRIYHVCLFMAFGYLGWNMSRNDPLVALVFCYIVFSRVSTDASISKLLSSTNRQSVLRFLAPSSAVLVTFLIYGIVSGSYHKDDQAPFEKIPWYGESIIYPHEAAKFVSTLVHVDEIYADHELLAALCIYHMRPDQYVFADARLEVNTKESLTNLREIRRLLNRDVSAGIALLETHGTGTKSLVFMNHTFFNPQLPSLLSNLAQSPDWICVYSDSYSEDPGPSRFITGATVFVPRSVFTEAQLPRVSLDPLLVRLQN
ncbi:MAG: hypothetical protein ACJZ8O_06550 [Pirellulaceae bacterium]